MIDHEVGVSLRVVRVPKLDSTISKSKCPAGRSAARATSAASLRISPSNRRNDRVWRDGVGSPLGPTRPPW